ncbi:MAG TPA: phosphoglucomutase/phosphomannomutase family protein [Terriglobia bacterium]|jgi:phosphomannomutase|nr:phosphoglucomutase/phosphomannomutase family protein [Terriglobia bacterium]
MAKNSILQRAIQFGTDGWRAQIGEDFSFENVRRVARAIADYVREEGEPKRGLLVGYDMRFLSPEAAEAAAEAVAARGVPVTLADRPTPTPAMSYAVLDRKAAGALVITASHNPSRWNGIKFKAPYGGSALPSIMQRVEFHLDRLGTGARPAPHRPRRASRQTADLVAPYLERLKSIIDFEAIRGSERRFVIDPMFGAARGVIAGLFDAAGIPCIEIHGEHNPLFPGLNPEPIEPHVSALERAVKDAGYDAGLATDGDADRIGAVNRDGSFIDSHKIFAILLLHLVEDLKLSGGVVKTFSTTEMIDRLAAKYHLPLTVTPIGFKYICELLLTRDVLIGGEESGGIATKGNPPERDGILNSLLLAEVMARRDRTLGELVQELEQEFGPHVYKRVDLEVSRPGMRRLLARLRHHTFRRIAGRRIASAGSLDGFKMLFEPSGWLLVRPSGTENLLRLYAEAPTRGEVDRLLGAAEALAREAEGAASRE